MAKTATQPTGEPVEVQKQTSPAQPARKINYDKYKDYVMSIDPKVITPVGVDLGYSSSKISFLGKLSTEPTAINFNIDTGLSYGTNPSFIFENEDLLVGENVQESFSTLDYNFKYKYDPLILFSILFKLKAINFNQEDQTHIELRIGLSLADWKNKDDYIKRLSEFEVDGRTFKFNNIKIIPQGAGAYIDYISTKQIPHPDTAMLLDIGYNTINVLYFDNGVPQRNNSRSFPGHGVSSIIKSFSDFLENEYGMSFSDAEALQIFLKNKFIYNGVDQEKVKAIIFELKNNFLKKLKNSILVRERKLLSTSEKVIFAGGGANLLYGTTFPPNVDFVEPERLYSNCRGFMLA